MKTLLVLILALGAGRVLAQDSGGKQGSQNMQVQANAQQLRHIFESKPTTEYRGERFGFDGLAVQLLKSRETHRLLPSRTQDPDVRMDHYVFVDQRTGRAEGLKFLTLKF